MDISHGTNYLAHHGILGMKWGVRRYQNEDGSLTRAGKIRAAKNAKRSGENYRGPDTAWYNERNQRADRGEVLLAKGYGRYGSDIKRNLEKASGIIWGANTIASIVNPNYNGIIIKNGYRTIASLNARTIGRGSTATGYLLWAMNIRDKADMQLANRRRESTRKDNRWAE